MKSGGLCPNDIPGFDGLNSPRIDALVGIAHPHGMKQPLFVVFGVCVTLFNCLAADEKHELTDGERAQLQRDKLIITGHSYRQVFSPYVFSEKPVFITTDSVSEYNKTCGLFEWTKGPEKLRRIIQLTQSYQSQTHINQGNVALAAGMELGVALTHVHSDY
jgi:hypothetical protein